MGLHVMMELLRHAVEPTQEIARVAWAHGSIAGLVIVVSQAIDLPLAADSSEAEGTTCLGY